MNKENCALKLVDEIILYYDARSKKTQKKCFIGFEKFRLNSEISFLFSQFTELFVVWEFRIQIAN